MFLIYTNPKHRYLWWDSVGTISRSHSRRTFSTATRSLETRTFISETLGNYSRVEGLLTPPPTTVLDQSSVTTRARFAHKGWWEPLDDYVKEYNKELEKLKKFYVSEQWWVDCTRARRKNLVPDHYYRTSQRVGKSLNFRGHSRRFSTKLMELGTGVHELANKRFYLRTARSRKLKGGKNSQAPHFNNAEVEERVWRWSLRLRPQSHTTDTSDPRVYPSVIGKHSLRYKCDKRYTRMNSQWVGWRLDKTPKTHVDFSIHFENYAAINQPTLSFFPIKRRSYKKKKKIFLLKHELKITKATNRFGKLMSIVKHIYFRWKRRRGLRNWERGMRAFAVKEVLFTPNNPISRYKSLTHERIGRDAVNTIIFRRRLENVSS